MPGKPQTKPAKPAAAAPAPSVARGKMPIVSSSHLASGRSAELSEFEFGMTVATNAFNRWCVRCLAAAGLKEMTITDVLVLHHINHRGREKKLADIAFLLNIEDTHVANYSLKTLLGLQLLQAEKRGKEVLYRTSEEGEALCLRYAEIREQMLVSAALGRSEIEGCYQHGIARRTGLGGERIVSISLHGRQAVGEAVQYTSGWSADCRRPRQMRAGWRQAVSWPHNIGPSLA